MISRVVTSALALVIAVASAVPAFAVEGDDVQSVDAPVAKTEVAPKKAEAKSEWQLKPRWRVQYDVAEIDELIEHRALPPLPAQRMPSQRRALAVLYAP